MLQLSSQAPQCLIIDGLHISTYVFFLTMHNLTTSDRPESKTSSGDICGLIGLSLRRRVLLLQLRLRATHGSNWKVWRIIALVRPLLSINILALTRLDYPRTLRTWSRRLQINFPRWRDTIIKDRPALEDPAELDAFLRKWRYMFVYAAAGFAKGHITSHMLSWRRDVCPVVSLHLIFCSQSAIHQNMDIMESN